MGQISTKQCFKCEKIAIPYRDKFWTKFCEDCYLEIVGPLTGSCRRCDKHNDIPRLVRKVSVSQNGRELKTCKDCCAHTIPYDSNRLYCDDCIESYSHATIYCDVCNNLIIKL